MKQIFFILTLIIFALLVSPALAQDQKEAVFYEIRTVDGNTFRGKLLEKNDDQIKLETETLGVIIIKQADVAHSKVLGDRKVVGNEIWVEYPQDTRYFWSPTGYGLKKGEGYYQNVWVFFNQAVYGFSNSFSMGFGTVPLFLFEGAPSPIWVTPKFSIPVDKNFNIGLGALAGTIIGEDVGGVLGIVYGVATLGNRQKNVSFGTGWGYADGQFASSPVFNVCGMVRVGQRGYVLSENYFFFGEESFAMLSLGGRSVIGGIGLDYGGMIPIADGTGIVIIPWLGLTVPF